MSYPEDDLTVFNDQMAQQQSQFASLNRAAALMQDPASLTRAKILSRMEYLQSVWSQCTDRHHRLLRSFDIESCKVHPYFTEDQYGTMEDICLDTVGAMQEFLAPPPNIINQPPPAAAAAAAAAEPRRLAQVPPMKLPHFSGAYKDWEAFRDYFTSVFINDRSFDNLQRLHYLKVCLEGEAAQVIKNISTTATNFITAWELLGARYSNDRRLLNIHLSSLFTLKPVTRENSPAEIQKLLDSAQESIAALEILGRPVSDDIAIFLVSQRLDRETREAWEVNLGDAAEFPTYEQLKRFLTTRIHAYEASKFTPLKLPSAPRSRVVNSRETYAQAHFASTFDVTCPLCNAPHTMFRCKKFIAKSVPDRWAIVRQTHACQNCLSTVHSDAKCQSTKKCSCCGARHHSLLHRSFDAQTIKPHVSTTTESRDDTTCVDNQRVDTTFVQSHLSTGVHNTHVVLSTAYVNLSSTSQRVIRVRALLDSGSTHTFISRELANALQSRTYPVAAVVGGIGNVSTGNIDRVMPINICPANSPTTLSANALILNSLTTYVPQFCHPLSHWPHLDGLHFADERPTDDTPIHVIIGSDLYAYALRDGTRRGRGDEPVAQNTIFGWILSGHTTSNSRADVNAAPVHVHHARVHDELSNAISRFWEIEEISTPCLLSAEDQQCEDHFRTTHTRTPAGRYVVRIPFRKSPPLDIGNSRDRAIKCLLSIERRLAKCPRERDDYQLFLEEYEELGHMRQTSSRSALTKQVYLPHHPVVKLTSTTTKTRVVFNASALSSNGKSLNDLQLTGPKLQSDLSLLHLSWRTYRYVYCADVEKMYRQILVDARDVDYQRILWRASPSDAISDYQLLTVTYGTASAPFLALRVLRQLAADEGDHLPLGKAVVLNSMFVDDALFGAETIDEAKQIRDQVNALLARGHFVLRKWASNSYEMLDDIDPSNHGVACQKSIQDDESLKILGIEWLPTVDVYRFVVSGEHASAVTKRTVLSNIARIFDPLGWISPVIIIAKILMQSLWAIEISWDSALPDEFRQSWYDFLEHLPSLNNIVIPRWIGMQSHARCILHGFSDASTKAYAAVIYIVVESDIAPTSSTLLISKTRVAPLKQLSVPRLELCAAVLLARLMAKVSALPAYASCGIRCWTDATIVLAWLRAEPAHWKTFVANRVAEVHTLLPNIEWLHVPGTENPADLASRGLLASAISQSTIWWHGPPWLIESASEWPILEPVLEADAPLEVKRQVVYANIATPATLDIFTRFSSWQRLLRVFAHILRWSEHWRLAYPKVDDLQHTASELTGVSTRIFVMIQQQQFHAELQVLALSKITTNGITCIDPNHPLPRNSPLKRLNPMLGSDGLLRVGGRLSQSNFDIDIMHPVILNQCHVAHLIALDAHRKCLHGGITLTLATLRRSTWLIQARKTVKSIVHRCIVCARMRADIPRQLMGSLPLARLTRPCRAFTECGVDYAGPIAVRMAAGRGVRSQPAYLSVFVCMATKAVHLELVTSLTTEAFLAAFFRFSSRRGLPTIIHSDRGTNFQGADKEIRAAFRAAVESHEFRARLVDDKVEWRFIPPAAPHFGGLWEAGVKSTKHHLNRVLGNHTPTYEELSTLLCRIEACLNSRPLAPLHEDPESLEVLTPAHFLVGGPLSALPAPSFLAVTSNRLTRWQLIQQMLEQFWHLWARDYVTSCQHRSKWLTPTANLVVGQIVLLRNDNLPPTKWELARVIKCSPGRDGLVRVVTIKTAKSEYVRPITKLALLPIDIEKYDDLSDTPRT